ncbi:MAG: glycosyl hydrolase family 95 catalytic domain-containing protein, partial [Armatimonadota bacterium]
MQINTAPNETLWYRHPALDWNKQVLHVGNGFVGASFHGNVSEERISISEKSFWTGGPGDGTKPRYGIREGGRDVIGELRRLILTGKIEEADALASQRFMGDYSHFGGLSTLGHLSIKTGHDADASRDYIRSLHLPTAKGRVSYVSGGTTYTRTVFCSYPDRVLVVNIKASRPGTVSLVVRQELAHTKRNPHTSVDADRGSINIDGNIDDNNRPYAAGIRVLTRGGSMAASGSDAIAISRATEVTIIHALATNYKLEPPLYTGPSPRPDVDKWVDAAAKRGFASLHRRHVKDVSTLYNAAKLTLAPAASGLERVATDERWKRYAAGDTRDIGLKVLAFNVGRYLLIAASRPGALPSGLQGAWNANYSAQWSGNYQVNINIPLIYMGGASLGLAECNQPFMDWIEAQAVPGHAVAKAYYGTNGWVTNATGNIWGHAANGLDLEWGLFPSGAAWLCRHLWEQYQFTGDKAFLRTRAYGIMCDASLFWLENLQEHKGELVAIPSVSAEQRSVNGFLEIPFQDIVFIRDLFRNTLKAASVLGKQDSFTKRVATALARLAPLRVGKYGQLQEWLPDIDDPMCRHRHFMHLSALHPCDEMDVRKDTALADAIRVSMNMRGDGSNKERLDPKYTDKWPCKCRHVGSPRDEHIGGNWSRSWKVWLWARLFDGDRADKILGELIGEAGMENMCQYQQVPPNRTPMQLDGAITTPGAMTEFLVQSHLDVIELLPALPSTWKSGTIEGVRTRFGWDVNVSWASGRLTGITLTAHRDGEHVIRY